MYVDITYISVPVTEKYYNNVGVFNLASARVKYISYNDHQQI